METNNQNIDELLKHLQKSDELLREFFTSFWIDRQMLLKDMSKKESDSFSGWSQRCYEHINKENQECLSK